MRHPPALDTVTYATTRYTWGTPLFREAVRRAPADHTRGRGARRHAPPPERPRPPSPPASLARRCADNDSRPAPVIPPSPAPFAAPTLASLSQPNNVKGPPMRGHRRLTRHTRSNHTGRKRSGGGGAERNTSVCHPPVPPRHTPPRPRLFRTPDRLAGRAADTGASAPLPPLHPCIYRRPRIVGTPHCPLPTYCGPSRRGTPRTGPRVRTEHRCWL